jgi:hypothetical protein
MKFLTAGQRVGAWFRRFWLFCPMLLSLVVPLFAGALVVSWNPNTEPDLAGYRVHYGTQPGTYTKTKDVGNVTSVTIDSLQEGSTYYFAVTAYDQSNNESDYSQEVSASVGGLQIDIVADDTGVELTWSAVSEADQYDIYYGEHPGTISETPQASVTATTNWQDPAPEARPMQGRYYLVKAVAGGQVVHTFDKVGVFNLSVTKGKNLCSIPLIPKNSHITHVLGAQLDGGLSSPQSDQVFVWDGSRYQVAWLVEGSGSALEGKWVTPSGASESNVSIGLGKAFWVMRKSDVEQNVKICGFVNQESEYPINLAQGTNFVGVPFPYELNLDESELAADGVVKGGSFAGASDRVMHWVRNQHEYEIAWLVGGTGTPYDGQWREESGVSESQIRLQPGYGYILWRKGERPSDLWTIPNLFSGI